jgi:hypothetical protein
LLRSGLLEIIVGLADLVHLLKPHGTEDNGEKLHRRVALRRGHLLKAGSATRHSASREVGPSRPLLLVVERVKNVLTLIGVER